MATIYVIGDAGNDIVNGGDGIDVINGGVGNDLMSGGPGADFFVFDAALVAANVDRIFDFTVADDTIRLDKSIFTVLALGALPAAAYRAGAAAVDATDRIMYDAGTGALLYDANGNAAGGPVQFGRISTGLVLSSADFTVIA